MLHLKQIRTSLYSILSLQIYKGKQTCKSCKMISIYNTRITWAEKTRKTKETKSKHTCIYMNESIWRQGGWAFCKSLSQMKSSEMSWMFKWKDWQIYMLVNIHTHTILYILWKVRIWKKWDLLQDLPLHWVTVADVYSWVITFIPSLLHSTRCKNYSP